MTKSNDLSGNDSSNNGNDISNNDLSNNDLSNNDLSNNDLSNNDLSNNDLFSDLVNINEPLHNESNISIELKEKNTSNENNESSDDENNDKLDEKLYYNYLYDDNKNKDEDDEEYDEEYDEENGDIDNYKKNLDKIEDLLKLIDDMYVLDENIKHLDEQLKNNFPNEKDDEKNDTNDEKNDTNDKKTKLNIKDNNKNKSMNNNKLVDEIIKEMDNNYGNNNNPYYNVNDLLFLNNNNNKIYKNSGTSTNLNIRNPNMSLVPITNNKRKLDNSEPEPEAEPEPEIEIEEVNVEASIENIEDLIKMIDKYPLEKHIKYNINMKAMHDIKPDLVELNKMIGMHSLKMNIVDQILYFIQDLHISDSKKKDREEKEIKERELKKKEKLEPKKKPPTISFRGGGLFSGLDLSSAFGGGAPKEPVCTDNDNNDYLHTVIYGPPGTGKTEVAKIMGKIYSKLGILKKGFFKKATRSDFVAGYLGQTAMKTKELIEECLGGVLFIDEAYALGNSEGRDSFAKEAIDTLCENLSNHKNDIMVIIAGYEKELNDCFFSFNQGLESRFPWRFKTEDYKADELKLIFKKQVLDSEWKIDDEDLKDEWFNSKMSYFKHYGRDMETLFSKVKIAHGRRIFCNLECEKKKLTIQDLDKGFESYLENENKQNIEHERIMKQIHNTLYV